MLMRPREGVVEFVSDVRVAEILKASDDSSFLLVAMLIISWDVDVAITSSLPYRLSATLDAEFFTVQDRLRCWGWFDAGLHDSCRMPKFVSFACIGFLVHCLELNSPIMLPFLALAWHRGPPAMDA